MKEIRIAGVSRGSEFSPNHIGNDAAIFAIVAESLRQMGFRVDVYTEKEFDGKGINANAVFNMARDRSTLNTLKELERSGCPVINSAFGIDNCVRRPMTELLIGNGIPHPESFIIPTSQAWDKEIFPCWIKRGDSHAMIKDDVCYVNSKEEACRVLEDFRNRNIPEAVVNRHLQGDLVKFYGVRKTGFFYWFYPSVQSHSKFGLEIINGDAKGIPFSEVELKVQCERASAVLNVPVYGGDCIVSADGKIKIIDFNDWPSFARCREEAGKQIAAFIAGQVMKNTNKLKWMTLLETKNWKLQ